jgi:hypothetical protein
MRIAWLELASDPWVENNAGFRQRGRRSGQSGGQGSGGGVAQRPAVAARIVRSTAVVSTGRFEGTYGDLGSGAWTTTFRKDRQPCGILKRNRSRGRGESRNWFRSHAGGEASSHVGARRGARRDGPLGHRAGRSRSAVDRAPAPPAGAVLRPPRPARWAWSSPKPSLGFIFVIFCPDV